MTKPQAMVACLGANTSLTGTSTLVATEMAAMGRILEDRGYEVCVNARAESGSRSGPPNGLKPWDGKTQPELIWFHQAHLNAPGGMNTGMYDQTCVVAEVIDGAKMIWRLVIDNNSSMLHAAVLRSLHGRGRKQSFAGKWRPSGPMPEYEKIALAWERHIDNGTFQEVGYKGAASGLVPYRKGGIFVRQLELTKELLPFPEKDVDFAYYGSNRGSDKKAKARLNKIGDIIHHDNVAFGGSLFKSIDGISSKALFQKAWNGMARARGHLILRDDGMEQKPLHRYVQALVLGAIPVVLGESEPPGFVNDRELRSALRCSCLAEALELLDSAATLKPALERELNYWRTFDEVGNQ